MGWVVVLVLTIGAVFVGATLRHPHGAAAFIMGFKERFNRHQNGARAEAVPKQEEKAMDLHHLPGDAPLLARECADHLKLGPALELPLERLLTSVSSMDGIKAVGYAVWRKPKMPPFLSIYALSDFTGLSEQDTPSPRPKVATEYDSFQCEVSTVAGTSLFTELSHVNTRHQRVEAIAQRFPDRLRDPFGGAPDPDERTSLSRLAVVEREERT